MKESVFSRGKGVPFKPPETVMVAGATGGIGKALTEAVAKQYPDATLIRLARDPARLVELNNPTIDLQFDLLDESSISEAINQINSRSVLIWLSLQPVFYMITNHVNI